VPRTHFHTCKGARHLGIDVSAHFSSSSDLAMTVRDTVTGLTRTCTKSRQGGVFPTTERDSTTFSCN
jgi:hypothetical protein